MWCVRSFWQVVREFGSRKQVEQEDPPTLAQVGLQILEALHVRLSSRLSL
jgi:hypothetical protein